MSRSRPNTPRSAKQLLTPENPTWYSRESPLASVDSFGNTKASLNVVTKEIEDPYPGVSPSDYGGQSQRRTWRTSFLRFGPLFGMLCMFIAILGLVASLAVLVVSDGAPVADWGAPPSTYLAICVAIANIAVRCACYQGVIVAWWYRALHGTTLGKLHYDWAAGTTFRGAVMSAFITKRMTLLGLACIASTFVVIDGPLLQRSSTVIPATIETPWPLTVKIAPEVPHNYTGSWMPNPSYSRGKMGFNQGWNETMPSASGKVPNNMLPNTNQRIAARLGKLWYENEPLVNVISGCPGECKATLLAPAAAMTSCTPYEVPVNYKEAVVSQAALEQVSAPSLNSMGFLISINLVSEEEESIDLVIGFSRSEDCVGTYKYTACKLVSAIGEYDVTISDDQAVVENPGTPRIIATANNTNPNKAIDVSSQGHASTLAGIVALGWDQWEGFVSMFKYNGSMSGAESNTRIYSMFAESAGVACPSFRDPMPHVLSQLNSLFVYAGVVAAETDSAEHLEALMDPGLQVNTQITGTSIEKRNVYSTDFRWFAGAAAFELLCICLIAPTFWGWWRLGRSFSFSPLEIANAFEAPALAHCDSNSTATALARAVGDTEVKYGSNVRTHKLAFGEQRSTASPQDDSGTGWPLSAV